jgi:hypothetical protein
MSIYLSKTDFIQSLDCRSSVWFSKHQPEKLSSHSETDLWRMEQGNEFESVVRQLFPEGVLIDGHAQEAVKKTEQTIADGASCLFQATAMAGDCLAKVDILQRSGDAWKLLEVKSSTEVKPEHLFDAAFQTRVLEQAGYDISEIFIVIANNQYELSDTFDPAGISLMVDVTDDVREVMEEIEELIEPALMVLRTNEPPSPAEHPCGLKPKDCPSAFHCYPELPEQHVFEIPRIRYDRARDMYDAGLISMHDLKDLSGLNTAQQFHVRLVQSGEPVLDREGLQHFLSQLTYPLSFLDYETANPVIPLFEDYRPYEQIVFQLSLHVLPAPGAELQHHEFLARGEVDPAPKLARFLHNTLPPEGSVIVWNQSFESARNRELGERVPAAAPFFEDLNRRIVDLMDVVADGLFVDPRFGGSASIKNVLPVLVPEMSYDDLEVGNGSLASLRWLQTRNEADPARKEQVRQHLLDYCRQDTLAMVALLKVFRQLSEA